MSGVTRDAVAFWEAQREERSTWQQRTSAQSARANKSLELKFKGKRFGYNEARRTPQDLNEWALRYKASLQADSLERETMGDLLLRDGVAIIYRSSLRYAAAPEDAITIDMFDANVELPEEFTAGTAKPILLRKSEQFNTMMVLREELPEFLIAKMDTLYVALKSCMPDRSKASFVITIPGVGAAYASGAMWVIITKEDLNGS